jgi:hypothetical protein
MNFVGSASFKVSVLLLLSVSTILFFNLYARFVVIGPELLRNNLFHNNLAEWEYFDQSVSVPNLDEGIVRLHSDNPAIIVGLSQTIPEATHYRLLKLACDTKTSNVPQGRGGWNTARVILVSHDPKGIPLWHLPYALAILHGTHEWEHHEEVFAVAADASRVSIFAQLAQTTGTLWVKNLSLRPVTEVASFGKFRNAVMLLWAVVAFWIVIPLVQSAFGHAHRSIIMALALAILFGALMPESLKERIGSSLFPSLVEPSVTASAATFKFTPLLSTPTIFEAGHLVMFAMLAAAAFYRRPYPVSRAQMLGYLLFFALVTEVLQLFVDGRSAQFSDVLVDSAGITMGWALLRAARIFCRPRA